MIQFLLKFLTKQRILAVHHDLHWLLVATKLLTANFIHVMLMGQSRESEIFDRSESESDILPTIPQGTLFLWDEGPQSHRIKPLITQHINKTKQRWSKVKTHWLSDKLPHTFIIWSIWHETFVYCFRNVQLLFLLCYLITQKRKDYYWKKTDVSWNAWTSPHTRKYTDRLNYHLATLCTLRNASYKQRLRKININQTLTAYRCRCFSGYSLQRVDHSDVAKALGQWQSSVPTLK